MLEILTRAGCFVAIIVLGYALRRIGFFKAEDFTVLSKIVIKITLPAAIVTSFAGKEIDPAMLSLALIGLVTGLINIALGWLINLRRGGEEQAFAAVNISGYNVGNFTVPFVQSFLGPVGVITASIFDVGNACIGLGTSYGVASALKGGGRFSPKTVLRSLSRSVPFLTYILMLVMNLTHIPVPGPVLSFAEIISGANAFMAMLMIGVGFKLSGDRSQMGTILRILSARYGMALVLSLACYFLLPMSHEVRVAMVVLMFSPIPSTAPAFTAELKSDVGLASAVNSFSILCSIVFIVAILLLLL